MPCCSGRCRRTVGNASPVPARCSKLWPSRGRGPCPAGGPSSPARPSRSSPAARVGPRAYGAGRTADPGRPGTQAGESRSRGSPRRPGRDGPRTRRPITGRSTRSGRCHRTRPCGLHLAFGRGARHFRAGVNARSRVAGQGSPNRRQGDSASRPTRQRGARLRSAMSSGSGHRQRRRPRPSRARHRGGGGSHASSWSHSDIGPNSMLRWDHVQVSHVPDDRPGGGHA